MAVVALDGRELAGRPTGVGRFLANLLAAWARLPEAREHRFVLYVPAAGVGVPPGLDVQVRALPGGSGTWWEQVRLAAAVRRDRPDVLFAPAYSAPLAAGVPVVVALHDLSFLAHPEWFPPRSRVRRRVLAALSARRASAVFTISEFSRGEIVARLNVPAGRVRVVPLAPGGPPVPRGLVREPMVLFAGSIFNRRHVPELIAACGQLAVRHASLRLEIAGEDRTYPRQDLAAAARASGLGDRLAFRAYLADAELALLYGRASAFAFLSDYEGFGLTPLEALSAGVPAVLGDTAVAREVCGDAALYVPTGDARAIAAAIEALLEDRPTRARLLAAAPAVLSRYSWERVGRETLGVLLEAATGRA